MTSFNNQEDFLRALSENRQWREAVRAQILGEELLQLPVKIDAYIARTDGFIAEQRQLNARLEGTIEQLKQSNARLERFVEEQQQTNEELRQMNARTDAKLDAFIDEQRETNARLERFVEEQRQLNEELRQMNSRTDTELQEFIREQKQTNARLERTIEELKQSNVEQRQTNEELRQMNSRTDTELQEFIREQRQRNEEMWQRSDRTEAELQEFIREQREANAQYRQRTDRLNNDIATLKGAYAVEVAWRHPASIAYALDLTFVRSLEQGEIARMCQLDAARGIPRNFLQSFQNADGLIEATDGENTHYIAVEASYTADRRDTERAGRNARFLTLFTGCPAHAVVVSVRNDYEIQPEIESGAVHWHQIEDRHNYEEQP